MAIFAISDLHLSFNTNKSMNIFGWDKYEEEIKRNWQENIEESKFDNIDFIYNNSYLFDNKVIVGTRGWNLNDETEDDKIRKREALRLELSIKDGIEKYGREKPIIACLHYPPLLENSQNTIFTQILEKYNINTCIYGHLHGRAGENAFEGELNNVKYIMVSCDYTKFKLVRI